MLLSLRALLIRGAFHGGMRSVAPCTMAAAQVALLGQTFASDRMCPSDSGAVAQSNSAAAAAAAATRPVGVHL